MDNDQLMNALVEQQGGEPPFDGVMMDELLTFISRWPLSDRLNGASFFLTLNRTYSPEFIDLLHDSTPIPTVYNGFRFTSEEHYYHGLNMLQRYREPLITSVIFMLRMLHQELTQGMAAELRQARTGRARHDNPCVSRPAAKGPGRRN